MREIHSKESELYDMAGAVLEMVVVRRRRSTSRPVNFVKVRSYVNAST